MTKDAHYHEHIMHRAIMLAEKNIKQHLGGPIACIIAQGENIIFEWSNRMSPHAYDPTAHAEIETIRAACKALQRRELSGFQLYTTSEPCPMCLGAIYRAEIDRIYYANSLHDGLEVGFIDAKIYQEFKKPLRERTVHEQRLLSDEGHTLYDHRKQRIDEYGSLKEYMESARAFMKHTREE